MVKIEQHIMVDKLLYAVIYCLSKKGYTEDISYLYNVIREN